MDSNGRTSPGIKRSRSRSPQGGKRNIQARGHNRSRERSVGGSNVSRRNNSGSRRVVYVANIPFDAKWSDVKDLFREKVGDVTYVELFQDETGKFRGCGIVELKEASSVQKAIDVLHRFEYRGRNLVVKEDYDLERDKVGRLLPQSGASRDRERGDRPMNMNDSGYRGGGGPSHGGGGEMAYNTYGLSPQFLDSLGITGPLSSKIFIANLDFKVTGRKLGEIFKIAGKIVNVDLKTDLDGNSRGHGIVEFEHPVEAVQAISMFNGQMLYNRLMSVRMDRFEHDDHDNRSNKLPGGLSGIGKGLGAGGQAIHLSSMGGNLGLGANLAQGAMNLMGNTALGLNPLAAAAAAMNAGLGTGLGATGLGALGFGAGLNPSVLAGAGLANTGLGLGIGLGAGGLGHTDRSLLGNNLGGSMGGGLGLGNNASLGLGASGNSGLGYGGLGGSGNSSASSSGLMGRLVGNSSLGGLGNLSGLSSSGMGNNSQSSLGGGGIFGDYGNSSFERSGSGLGTSSGGGGGGGGVGDVFHGNRQQQQLQQQQQHQQQSSDTILVQNLPNNYNWQTLRERFRDIGDIRDAAQKGRGAAVLRFNTERDAQRAVDLMNGIRIEGRPIEVRLY